MTPDEAAQELADTMNRIEAAGFVLYPHPRPVGISIRVAKQIPCLHPDHTKIVAKVWDEGDGRGWQARSL
jgi:hypothetical protein